MQRNGRAMLQLPMSQVNLGQELRKARGSKTLRDMEALTGVDFTHCSVG